MSYQRREEDKIDWIEVDFVELSKEWFSSPQ